MSRAGRGLIALAVVVACGGGDGPEQPNDNFDRKAMLANIGDNLLIPVYDRFQTAATDLETAAAEYCTALGGVDEAAALAQAQVSWAQAMDAWQLAESMLFGPAAMNEATLRQQVYSWPTVSTCAVDQEVAAYQASPAGVDIATKLNNRRGLDALEYLLFSANLDHTCPVQTAPAGWNELADADRRAARCGYAALAAADVKTRATIVVDAWSPAGGNFIADLKNAGDSGSSFDSAQQAVNVVSDALFYIDTEVKDMKLGEPAGITLNSCNSVEEPCLAELESQFAFRSKDEIAINLRGTSLLFHGNSIDGAEGIGFDDFLIELGAPELATSLSADLARAQAEVDAISGSLRDALSADYAQVAIAYQATKDVTTALKSQFLTVLGLDLPDSAAGDND